jgi:hypothetical protein
MVSHRDTEIMTDYAKPGSRLDLWNMQQRTQRVLMMARRLGGPRPGNHIPVTDGRDFTGFELQQLLTSGNNNA